MDKTILGHLVFLTVLFCTFFSSLAFTEELEKKVDNKDIESIVVLGVRQRLYKAGEL